MLLRDGRGATDEVRSSPVIDEVAQQLVYADTGETVPKPTSGRTTSKTAA